MFTHTLTHTRIHTVEPTGAPHVTLTQFRSVAQSRAGIQNKKTVTFKNRLTFFSSHWWDSYNGSIHLLCQWHLQLIILSHLQLATSEIHTLYSLGSVSVQLAKNRIKTIFKFFTFAQLKDIPLSWLWPSSTNLKRVVWKIKSSNINGQVGHLSLPSDITHRTVSWISTTTSLKNK